MIILKKKDVLNHHNVIALPYCTAQKLFNIIGTNFCNSGSYGWNCDLFFLNDVVISTGYRSFGIKPKQEMIDMLEEYESKIFEIETSYVVLIESISSYLEYWTHTVLEMHNRRI